VRTSYAEAEPVCFDGYALEGTGYKKVCKRSSYIDLEYKCEEGNNLAYYDGKYECIVVNYADGEYKCSTGYTREWANGAYKCVKSEFKASEPKCTSGYFLRDVTGSTKKACVKSDYKSIGYKCNDNSYTPYDSTKCKKAHYKDITYTCPYGYTSQDGSCVKYETGPAPAPYCKGSFYSLTADSTRCYYSDDYEALTVCKQGYKLQDGQCYYSQAEPPTWDCGYGWELKGQACWGPCEKVDQTTPITQERGCIGNIPFGLESCVCDGAELGMLASVAACGRVASECNVLTGFGAEEQLEAISRICDTFALDACLSAASMPPPELSGCSEILMFGTSKCTPQQAQIIYLGVVSSACDPLCPDCARIGD
jgi:hypothetical protein